MRNYYDELEVSKTASPEMIGKVYKILAKKYHPDTTKESNKQAAEEKFKIISEAYEVLSDDEKRKKYDLELEQNNPTISYEDYMNVVNQRDYLNNSLINLQNEFNMFKNSYNPNNTYYNSNFQEPFNTNQFQDVNNQYEPNVDYEFNNWQNNNQNYNNEKRKNNSKAYYYNTVTGQPVSAGDYYKYKIKKLISSIVFYILLIIAIIAFIKNLLSIASNNIFFK